MSAPDSTAGLIAALRQVADDAEDLLRESADHVSGDVAGLRTRMTQSLHGARRRLRQAESRAAERVRIGALLADRYVHRNPWKVVGMAGAAAFVLGVLLALPARVRDRE